MTTAGAATPGGQCEDSVRISMIGTRGVPARYGGFETAVEEVGRRLVERGHVVTVYSRGRDRRPEYLGMRRVVLPSLPRRSLETLSHTFLSVLHVMWPTTRPDVAFVFNAANAPLAILLRLVRIPLVIHVDGLEWKRSKWGRLGRAYYLFCERLAARIADELIADARGIQDYYRETYGVDSCFIAYGAPNVEADRPELVDAVGVRPGEYHLVVARMEPENHVDVIVEGYIASDARHPLVVVGSVPYESDHLSSVTARASRDSRVRMVGSVWDQDLLDQLYANCATYLHGHSVGGTNPSLLRAMGAGAFVIAWDVNFNREIVRSDGEYFSTPAEATAALNRSEAEPAAARERAEAGRKFVLAAYDWDAVAGDYEDLAHRTAATADRPGSR